MVNNKVVKLPFVANKFRSRRLKAKKVIQQALNDDAKFVVVITLNDLENSAGIITRSNCGSIWQSMALLDIAKQSYLEQFKAKTIMSGKFDREITNEGEGR